MHCKRAITLCDSVVAKSGERFDCSFRKKAGGAIEHFAEKMPDTTRQHAIRASVTKRGWISPCGGAGGATSPLQKIGIEIALQKCIIVKG